MKLHCDCCQNRISDFIYTNQEEYEDRGWVFFGACSPGILYKRVLCPNCAEKQLSIMAQLNKQIITGEQ